MKGIYMLTENRLANRFTLFCAFLKCLFVAFIFYRVLFLPVNFYELGELLLNYRQGFQRRSLIGTLIFAITSNQSQIFFVIKCLNLMGIGCLLFLIYNPLIKYPVKIGLALTIIFICSPFGMSFYSEYWLKKEILFFPFLLVARSSLGVQNTTVRLLLLNGTVVAGCLIHEAFIFLGMPFIACLSYLNSQKPLHILSLPLTGICSLALIFLFSVRPEPAITNYVISLQHMGFDTTGDLTHPLRYFRMGTKATIISTAVRFKFSYSLMYAFLYFLNGYFVYRILPAYPDLAKMLNRRVLACVILIHISIVPLFFIGLDYGRWFSFAFILSILLLLNQPVQKQTGLYGPLSPKHLPVNWILFSIFYLFISIPQMATFNIYRPMDYAVAFLTFMKPF
jgi:hypothetical protein